MKTWVFLAFCLVLTVLAVVLTISVLLDKKARIYLALRFKGKGVASQDKQRAYNHLVQISLMLLERPDLSLRACATAIVTCIILVGLLAKQPLFAFFLSLCFCLAVRLVPQVVFRQQEAERLERAIAELPNLIDIVSLGMSAGISFDAALGLYCERSSSELSSTMRRFLQSWSMGVMTREEAFAEICTLYQFEGMRRFCETVLESLRFGSPLTKVLEQQSSKMRKDHQAYVQEKIEKAPVKMLIPVGILILPAMLLSIAGPLVSAALIATS